MCVYDLDHPMRDGRWRTDTKKLKGSRLITSLLNEWFG